MKTLAICDFMSLVLNTCKSIARTIGIDLEFRRSRSILHREIIMNFAIITLLNWDGTVYLHYKTCFAFWLSGLVIFINEFPKHHGVALMVGVLALSPSKAAHITSTSFGGTLSGSYNDFGYDTIGNLFSPG